MSKSKKKASFSIHPREISICGYSGSGKTTLIKKLMNHWQSYRVAYFKSDAHKFSMDRPGKDTFEIFSAGAQQVFIEDKEQSALIRQGQLELFQKRAVAWDYDFVIVEGHKFSKFPKLLVLDDEGLGLKDLQEGRIVGVHAVIGHSKSCAPDQYPFFHRDQVEEIAAFIMTKLLEAFPIKPLSGLVLSGGQSTRMGRDKALLDYHGRPQALHAYEQLSALLPDVYLSSRPGQWQGTSLDKLPQIYDLPISAGPMAGILSAMMSYPERAWLVVACDLPYLDLDTLQTLLDNRNPFRLATYFQSQVDGMPEPLCAIYEDRMKSRLWEAFGHDYSCPRKVLINSSCQELKLNEGNRLENINHKQEYLAIQEEGLQL